MSTDLDLCLKHLKSLVGFDTSNPPRKIKESGLIAYLNSLDFIDPQIQDHGGGSFNIFFTSPLILSSSFHTSISNPSFESANNSGKPSAIWSSSLSLLCGAW